MKLSDYLIDYLVNKDVSDVFLLSGGGCMHLIDSIGKNKKINYFCNLHEQACAISTEAYSQYKNTPGVCIVTTGPGGTNAITGVAGSFLDSTPMIVISGQVKTSDNKKIFNVRQYGPQEIDIISIVKPITKYAATVTNPSDIKKHLDLAFHHAQSDRPGPCWLDIPLDIQASEIDPKKLIGAKIEKHLEYIEEGLIKNIIKDLKKAKRPAFLLGNGIRLANAQKKLSIILERVQIPTLLTWKASDLLEEEHPQFAGRPGSIGQRGANFTQQTCDLLICIGARLDVGQVAFNYDDFAPKAKKYIIDIDEKEFNKYTFEHVKINQCAGHFLDTLGRNLLKENTIITKKAWLAYSKNMHNHYQENLLSISSEKGVDLYKFIDLLSEVLDKNYNIVPGSSGACSEVLYQKFRVKKDQRIINTPGLGAMGFGLPASIGVCLASSKKSTVLINGDGGFQLNIQELETIKSHKLPIIIFILQNNGYRSIKISQESHFNSNFVACDTNSGVSLPSMKKIANAYDFDYFELNQDNLNLESLKNIVAQRKYLICDVYIQENHITAPRTKAIIKDNGQITSTSMADLFPFLDRDEYKQRIDPSF